MSTKTQLENSKLTTAIVSISGTYLFFITLILAPYINLPIFSSFHTTTKLILIVSAALIGLLQLFFLVPRFPKMLTSNIPSIIKYLIGAILLSSSISLLFAGSLKTAIWGMFSSWESNTMITLVFSILLFAWTTYFLVLKEFHIDELIFISLLKIAIFVASFYAIGEYYFWQQTDHVSFGVDRISLGFRNPLFAAYFIGMLWTFAAMQFLQMVMKKNESFRFIKSLAELILFGLVTHALLLTFTRSAWISAGVAVAVLALTQITLIRKQSNLLVKQFIAGIFIIVILVLAQIYSLRTLIYQRNEDIAAGAEQTLTQIAATLGKEDIRSGLDFYQKAQNYSSAEIRLLEWQWGLRVWTGNAKNFLFGIGPDNGFFELPKYRDAVFNNIPSDATVKPQHIRNMYIDFLMEHGIIAALAIVALGILLYKPLITVLTNDAHYFAPLAIIVGYLAQGLFYFPTMLTTVLFVFSLGFMVAKLLPNTVALNLPTTSEKSVILLLVILLLAWLIPLTKADYTLSLYGQSPLPFSAEDMRKNLGLPISNNILKRYFAYFHPRETEGIEILATLASSNDMDDLRVAGDVYYVLAKDSNTLAEVNSSIAALEKLTQIDPTVPSNWDMLGLRYLFIRNYDKATSSFEKAISLKEDYWYSYLHIGETLRQQCSPEKAIEWYKKAEQYVPSAQTEIEEAKQEIITPRKECL